MDTNLEKSSKSINDLEGIVQLAKRRSNEAVEQIWEVLRRPCNEEETINGKSAIPIQVVARLIEWDANFSKILGSFPDFLITNKVFNCFIIISFLIYFQ